MKKITFASVVALLMAIGTYSLVSTENASILPTLQTVEAMAQDETNVPREIQADAKMECCIKWEMTGVDDNGKPMYSCTKKDYKDAKVCATIYTPSTCTPQYPC